MQHFVGKIKERYIAYSTLALFDRSDALCNCMNVKRFAHHREIGVLWGRSVQRRLLSAEASALLRSRCNDNDAWTGGSRLNVSCDLMLSEWRRHQGCDILQSGRRQKCTVLSRNTRFFPNISCGFGLRQILRIKWDFFLYRIISDSHKCDRIVLNNKDVEVTLFFSKRDSFTDVSEYTHRLKMEVGRHSVSRKCLTVFRRNIAA